jgi:hypothetical protein
MHPTSLLRKTRRGVEEIETRKMKLPGRLRNVLFMVDGERVVASYLEQAGGLAEQLETQLGELLTLGFIEEVVALADTPSTPAPDAPEVSQRAKPASTPPTAPTPAPAAVAPPTPVPAPLTFEVMHARLSKYVTDSMGMRAMFLSSQLAALKSRADLENFIDETAKGMSTASGPESANKWRALARATLGES